MSKTPPHECPATPLGIALDLLDDLGGDGLRVVPDFPDTGMIAAGSIAGEVSAKTAAAIYLAMIAAID